MKHRIILPKNNDLGDESRLLLTQLSQQFSYPLFFDYPSADSVEEGDLVYDAKDQLLKLSLGTELFSFSLVDQFFFHRKKRYALKSEPLARALGNKYLQTHWVYDATCGTGRDLCLYLNFGVKKVRAFERNPVVYCLLKFQWQALCSLVPEAQLELNFGELRELEDPSLAIVYFDPMYPEKKKKSSLSRKEMEVFKILVGEDLDSEEFFSQLLDLRPKRCVVKRPLKSEELSKKPTDSFAGKSTRYDLFV